jgi:tetratricopeptide (TPR) repeat protein
MTLRPKTWLTAALVAVAVACAPKSAPAPVVTTPKFPTYPRPDIPAALRVSRDVADRHDVAWRRLQSGDLRGANRDFAALFKQQPTLYPAETGLGFVELAERDFKDAVTRFSSVLAREGKYIPALVGLAEAHIGLNNDGQAVVALERVLAIDPKREAARSRLELLRFRMVQELIDEGRRARQANRLDAAEQAFEQALSVSPASTLILRELAHVELQAGRAEDAESHVRQAVKLDAGDAEGHAALGNVLEARGRFREAAASYRRAVSLDDRPDWRTKVSELSEKADMAALPREFGNLQPTASITRAHVAAYVGVRLGTLIEAAPRRAVAVATDVGRHWASPWILPVTRAGIMNVYPNHTFQPASVVRRGDLAQVTAQLIALAVPAQSKELAAWRAARPRFADLPSSNVFYQAAAHAVAAGVMSADAAGNFRSTQPATGADLTDAIARIDQLSSR